MPRDLLKSTALFEAAIKSTDPRVKRILLETAVHIQPASIDAEADALNIGAIFAKAIQKEEHINGN